MIESLEESLDVEIEYPIVAPASLPRNGKGIFRRFLRPVSIRVLVELRIDDRLEKARDHHLRDPIRDRGNPQRARSAVAFWNLYATYRWREIAARCKTVPELVEVR